MRIAELGLVKKVAFSFLSRLNFWRICPVRSLPGNSLSYGVRGLEGQVHYLLALVRAQGFQKPEGEGQDWEVSGGHRRCCLPPPPACDRPVAVVSLEHGLGQGVDYQEGGGSGRVGGEGLLQRVLHFPCPVGVLCQLGVDEVACSSCSLFQLGVDRPGGLRSGRHD